MSNRPAVGDHPLSLIWPLLSALALMVLAGDGTLNDRVQQQVNRETSYKAIPEIVVVLVDEPSGPARGGFGSRSGIECLVRLIAAQKPSAIALDYFFGISEGDDSSPPQKCGESNKALDSAGIPLVVASRLDWSSGSLQSQRSRSSFVPQNAIHGFGEIRQSRRDSVVRQVQLYETTGDGALAPSFALAAWLASVGTDHGEQREANMLAGGARDINCLVDRLHAAGAPCEIDREQGWRTIRFHAPDQALTVVSADELLQGECGASTGVPCLPPRLFMGKLVFVGDRDNEADLFRTPLHSDLIGADAFLKVAGDQPKLPGVVIHALIARNVAADDFVKAPGWIGVFCIVQFVAALGMTSLGLAYFAGRQLVKRRKLSPIWAHFTVVVILASGFAGSVWAIQTLAVWCLRRWGIGIEPLLLILSLLSLVTLLVFTFRRRLFRTHIAPSELLGTFVGSWIGDDPDLSRALRNHLDAQERYWYRLTISIGHPECSSGRIETLKRLKRDIGSIVAGSKPDLRPDVLPVFESVTEHSLNLLVLVMRESQMAHKYAADLLQQISIRIRETAHVSGGNPGSRIAMWAGCSRVYFDDDRIALGLNPIVVRADSARTSSFGIRLREKETR